MNPFDPITQPNQHALADRLQGSIDKHGPISVHASWGDGASKLTVEERAGEILAALNAPNVPDLEVF